MDKERVWNDTTICHFKAEIYHNQTEFTPTTSIPAFPICQELCIASLSENSTFPEFSLHAVSNNNIRFKSMFVLPYHLLHLQLQAWGIPTTGPLNTDHIQESLQGHDFIPNLLVCAITTTQHRNIIGLGLTVQQPPEISQHQFLSEMLVLPQKSEFLSVSPMPAHNISLYSLFNTKTTPKP